jgi:hypothetical protein
MAAKQAHDKGLRETTIGTPLDKAELRPAPRQIEYKPQPLPADLSEHDWSVMLEVLDLVKRTVPTNDERPPQEIFQVMRKALLAHFAEPVDSK